MSAETSRDVSHIHDEETLKRMWQDTEDFGRKKEIRAHMYKLREAKLREFYNSGEVSTDIRSSTTTTTSGGKFRDVPTHADSIADHSFISMKTKEIRDSESPTRDSCYRITDKSMNLANNQGWNVVSKHEVSDDGKTVSSSKLATTSGSDKIPGGKLDYAAKNEQKTSVYQDGDENNFKKAVGASSSSFIKQEAAGGDENSAFKSSSTRSSSSSQFVSEQRSSSGTASNAIEPAARVPAIDDSVVSVSKKVYTNDVPSELKNHPNYVDGKTKVTRETRTLADGSSVTTTRYEVTGSNTLQSSAKSHYSTSEQLSSTKSSKTTSEEAVSSSKTGATHKRIDQDSSRNVPPSTQAIITRELDIIPADSSTFNKTTTSSTSRNTSASSRQTQEQRESSSSTVLSNDQRTQNVVLSSTPSSTTTKTTKTTYVYDSQEPQVNEDVSRGDYHKTTIIRNVSDARDQVAQPEQLNSRRTVTTSRPVDETVTSSSATTTKVTSTRDTIDQDNAKVKRTVLATSKPTEEIVTKVTSTTTEYYDDVKNPEETKAPKQPRQQPDDVYSPSERRQPIKPGKSELDQKSQPTEGQYDTTYRSEFTNKRISVDVSPTHDAFARSLRSVTPDRISRGSPRTSTTSLRSSTSPEKYPSRSSSPRKSTDRFASNETITYTNNRKNTDSLSRRNKITSTTTATSEIDSSTLTRKKKPARSPSPTSTASDIEFIRNTDLVTDLDTNITTVISKNRPSSLDVKRGASPTKTQSPTKDYPRNDRPLRRTDTYEDRCRQILGIASTDTTEKRRSSIDKNRTTTTSTTRSTVSTRSPTKESPTAKKYPERGSPSSPSKTREFPRKSPEKRVKKEEPQRRSSPTKVTPSQIRREPSPVKDIKERTTSPSKISEFPSQIRRSPEREPLSHYPEKTRPSPDRVTISEFPSQIRRSPEREPLPDYPGMTRITPERKVPGISEFPSQIRKSPDREPLREYPEKIYPCYDTPHVTEFPSQIRRTPDREPLGDYPEKRRPSSEKPTVSEFPSQIRRSPEKEHLGDYPEKRRPSSETGPTISEFPSQIRRGTPERDTSSPERRPIHINGIRKSPERLSPGRSSPNRVRICESPTQFRRSPDREPKSDLGINEFPSQIRRSPEREPFGEYPEKRRPSSEKPTISEFPSQIKRSPEKEPLEKYPEKRRPSPEAPKISEFPSHVRRSPERESPYNSRRSPCGDSPERKVSIKDLPSQDKKPREEQPVKKAGINEFPSQIRRSPERQPLGDYPQKKRPTSEKPTICEFPSQIRRSPAREPLGEYPEKKRPTSDKPTINEFPSQIRKSPERQPLGEYPEKKRPTSEKPEVNEVSSQIRRSPERQLIGEYSEKKRPSTEKPTICEFPSQIRRSPEREPLGEYPEKKRPVSDKPTINEFPSQVRKSPERQPEKPTTTAFPSQPRKSPERPRPSEDRVEITKFLTETDKKDTTKKRATAQVTQTIVRKAPRDKPKGKKPTDEESSSSSSSEDEVTDYTSTREETMVSTRLSDLEGPKKKIPIEEPIATKKFISQLCREDEVDRSNTTTQHKTVKKDLSRDTFLEKERKHAETTNRVISNVPNKKPVPSTVPTKRGTDTTNQETTKRSTVTTTVTTPKRVVEEKPKAKKPSEGPVRAPVSTTKTPTITKKPTTTPIVQTSPKRHVVSTTVTITRTTGTKPTQSKPVPSKVVQNGHHTPSEPEEDTVKEVPDLILKKSNKKITRTASDQVIKVSPRHKTPVRGMSKPELVKKKVITTKSITINNGDTVIVDLQRSKSSREDTPEQVCPLPVSYDDGSAPRLPDKITEPDDVTRPKKLSDLLEIDSTSTSNRIVEVTTTTLDEDDSLLSVNKKISKFSDAPLSRPKTEGPAPKVPRPRLVVDEDLEEDECLLSVSEKVSKFITTAEQLTAPETVDRPKSPKCQYYDEEDVNVSSKISHFITTSDRVAKKPTPVTITTTKKVDMEETTPNRKPQPSSDTPKKSTEPKYPRRDSSPKFSDTTPKTTRRSSEEEKLILSETGRLRSTETIKKAKALFENISKEQQVPRQRDILSRPSVFDAKTNKPEPSSTTSVPPSHASTVSSTLKSTRLVMEKLSPRRSPSPELSQSPQRNRSREETPDRDLPGYMRPLDRTLRPTSPHRDSITNTIILQKEDNVVESSDVKTTKFGVTLKRTDSGKAFTTTTFTTTTAKPRPAITEVITEAEIEEIYSLELLEELLEKVTGYELRRKIRTQIRIVKKLISENKLQEIITRTSTRGKSPTKQVFSSHQRTKEEFSTSSFSERRTSSDRSTQATTTTKTTTTQRVQSPERREPKPAPAVRTKSPEKSPERKLGPSKVQLKKSAPLSKNATPEDAAPEWVRQRNLKKVSDRTTSSSKVTSSSVTSTSTTKKSRCSPLKEVKPTDLITSSYGVGPTDENGTPLFGLKALRAKNNKSDTTTKVQGTVIRSQYYSENGNEPVGEISVMKYSTDPKDLGKNETCTNKGVTSVTTTQKFGYKDTPSLKSITSTTKKIEDSDTKRTISKSMTKENRRNSVKALSQKFIENAVETLKSENKQQTSYPKAGLILRTSSFKDTGSSDVSREGSTERTVTTSSTVKTAMSSSRTVGGESFLTNRSKVTGVQDVISRMKSQDVREGETTEDIEARGLLNKFLGAQVILSGFESSAKSSTSTTTSSTGVVKKTTKVTTTVTEGGKPTTRTRIFQHPITDEELDTIWDEQTLRLLLEQSTDYEERRKIRAKLRQVMAEQEACTDLVDKASREQGAATTTASSTFDGAVTEKTTTDGPVSTTQVTTTKVSTTQQQTQSKKPLSPFAKFRQLDKQNSQNSPNSPKTPSGSGPLFKFTDPALAQSANTIKDRLLFWCRMKTKEYENIQLDNFSTSWADGLAFCALIHHFLPDAFDYHALSPKNRRHNFTLAFQVADEKADIAPLLDVDDMVATRKPDWKCVFTYVQSIYRRFKDED